MGDEEYPSLDLAACQRLGNVVQHGGETESLDTALSDAGSQPIFFELALDTPDDLEGVLEGIQVVEGSLADVAGQG
jgi:hypothetical protein